MKYKPIIFERNKDGDQYIIVNDDRLEFEANLGDNENIIGQLSSRQCPIGQTCVDYIEENHISRFCQHFICFLQIAPYQFSFERFFCNKGRTYREVSVIKPASCNEGRNCIACGKLLNIRAIPFPEKSNCHVVCG